MHEISIAQGLMKILLDEAEKHRVSKINRVLVRVGELANLVPDALLFAFDSIKDGTVAEGATLEIEVVPARGRCDHCDTDFDVSGAMFFCPHCNNIASEIVSGKELEVVEIDAD